MSVLVKGMEMPTSCDLCLALDDYGDYPRCRITNEQRGYNFPVREQRMGNCPLVPVPPHGRLIDADALDDILADQSEDEYNRTHAPKSWERALSVMRDYLKDTPTIITAEWGEWFCADGEKVDKEVDE